MYFDELLARIRASDRGWSERHYRIAGRPVRLLGSSPALLHCLSRAFDHLAAPPAAEPALTVHIADSARIGLPPCPWELPPRSGKGGSDPEAAELMHVRDERVDGLLRLDGTSVSALDREAGIAVLWLQSQESVPRSERAAPLRAILDWWGAASGWRVVHAGAVGTANGGALLVGRAGSGKSTSVLACLGSGLSYAGDDGVAVSAGGTPFVHSLYCTAKLEPDHLRRALPHLAPALDDSEVAHLGKRMFFLSRDRSAELTAGFPLRAVLLPRVSDTQQSATRPASAGAGLLALAPSTLLQLPGSRAERLHHMAAALRQVPTHVLELGRDLSTVAPAIRAVLDGAGR